MPERTAESIDAARWMHTGDLAVMDGSGYVNSSNFAYQTLRERQQKIVEDWGC